MEKENKNDINLIENVIAVMQGFAVAKRIVTNDPETHYLIMNRHVGDDFRMLRTVVLFKKYYSGKEAYYNESKYGKLFQKNWVVKKVIIVTDENHAGIARLFSSVDEIITLSKKELDDITLYAKSYICVHKNLHRDEYGSLGDERVGDDLLKSKIFGFPSYNWVLDIPLDFPAKGEWMLSDMKLSQKSAEKAYNFLTDNNLLPHKTVILFPYAKSTSMLLEQTWNVFAKYLLEQGFTVFTNVSSDEEISIYGTKELKLSVDIVMALGVAGCLMIGVQSGIMDCIRWFPFDIKAVIIHPLYTDYDRMCARNRKLEKEIERRENTTYLLAQHTGEEIHILEKGFCYYQKGIQQYEQYLKVGVESDLWNSAKNLNEYIDAVLLLSHVVLFIAVCDSANKYWPLVAADKLGLTADLSVEWRRSYVAVIDKDENFIYEELGSNAKTILYQSTFLDMSDSMPDSLTDDNIFYVSSHAYGKGRYTKAAIVINGIQYAMNQRGINLVVFSKEKNCVIDSISVDLWGDSNLTVKRK